MHKGEVLFFYGTLQQYSCIKIGMWMLYTPFISNVFKHLFSYCASFVFYINKMFMRLIKAKILRSASCLLCRKLSQDRFSPNFFIFITFFKWQCQVPFPKKHSQDFSNIKSSRCYRWPAPYPRALAWSLYISRLPTSPIALTPTSKELPLCTWLLLPGLGTAQAAAKSTCLYLTLSPFLTLAAACWLSFWLLPGNMLPPSFFLLNYSILLKAFNQFICITRPMCLGPLAPGHCLQAFLCQSIRDFLPKLWATCSGIWEILWLLNYQLGSK